ncbi:unnamed protein product [Mytilus edulis]|uniref:Uncharacterized protein n=1 Tax=Mytilus edulis TaxID=6550 RepID=A0A8S3RZB2_MYTED|nr:unnamed protein product [Mytilus edulis]
MSTSEYSNLGKSEDTWTCPSCCKPNNSSTKIYFIPNGDDSKHSIQNISTNPLMVDSISEASIPSTSGSSINSPSFNTTSFSTDIPIMTSSPKPTKTKPATKKHCTNHHREKSTNKMINEYKKLLNDPVDMLIDKMRSFSYVDIDAINDEFVNILHTAADIAIPKCGFNPHTKPYWNADVKRAHDNERSKRRCWVLEGRPRGMHFDSYRMYKRAKSEFRRVQQVANEQYIQSCYDDLNETAECDVRLFWKQIFLAFLPQA